MGRIVNPFGAGAVDPEVKDPHAMASAIGEGIPPRGGLREDSDDWVATACNRDAITPDGDPAELCF